MSIFLAFKLYFLSYIVLVRNIEYNFLYLCKISLLFNLVLVTSIKYFTKIYFLLITLCIINFLIYKKILFKLNYYQEFNSNFKNLLNYLITYKLIIFLFILKSKLNYLLYYINIFLSYKIKKLILLI